MRFSTRRRGVHRADPVSLSVRWLRNSVRDSLFRARWRLINTHNYTTASHYFKEDNVQVGRYSYGTLNVIDDGGSSILKIGSFCSIADGVVFLLNADHITSRITTYPLEVKYYHELRSQAIGKGNITIGDDCWIGHGVYILSGATLGQGSIIAARATVTKDVPAYAIVGGSPAKFIRWRFNEEVRTLLARLDFGTIDDDFLLRHRDLLLAQADPAMIETLISQGARISGGNH